MHVCTMAILKDIGLATNVNDSMDADGMAAAGVTQASEQAKSREFLTKHWYKKQEDDCHSVDMEIVVKRRAEDRVAAEADTKSKHKEKPHQAWTGAGNA